MPIFLVDGVKGKQKETNQVFKIYVVQSIRSQRQVSLTSFPCKFKGKTYLLKTVATLCYLHYCQSQLRGQVHVSE